MSDVSQWSPVDANNDDPAPDGFPEGMPASAVNDSSRAVMGSVRRLAEEGGWFDWGHSATYVSGTEFQVPGDLTAVYTVGRRIRATQTGTLVGTISDSSVSVNTTVTVSWDSGSLANASLTVALGPEPNTIPGSFITGEIRMYGAATAPNGWLLCDGAAVSRTTYATLFAIIGTSYGAGDGSTTFNVPDFQGRSPVGSGAGASLTSRAIGDSGGDETHTLTVGEMPAHSHDLLKGDSGLASTARAGNWDGSGSPTQQAGNIVAAGGGAAHNNMHPFLVANFIIKT